MVVQLTEDTAKNSGGGEGVAVTTLLTAGVTVTDSSSVKVQTQLHAKRVEAARAAKQAKKMAKKKQ
jgi:hypothetical protein